MRKQIWITCAVVLVACLVLLVLKIKQQKTATLPEQSEGPTNQPSQQEQPKSVAHHQVTNIAQLTATLPPMTPLAEAISKTNPIAAMRLAMWQAPIDFYGKAIDENSNPVAGVTIHFNWSELPEKGGERTLDTQSDAEGLFALQGKRGASLSVSFGKKGYYSSGRGEKAFSYALPRSFSPDPQNPVVFKLHKKGEGESLITSAFPTGMGQIAQLHHDGTLVEIDLFKGAEVPAGSGQLKLEFWRDITNQNANIFDWKCQLTVPGGGLIETPEEFDFQAPERGYQPSIVIDMPATNQNWFGEVRTKYYIQLPNGNYGRIDFYLLPYNGVFTIHSAINPTGSRNLEP